MPAYISLEDDAVDPLNLKMSDHLLARPSRKVKNLEIYDFMYNEIKAELQEKKHEFNKLSNIKQQTAEIMRKKLFYKHFVTLSKNFINDLKSKVRLNKRAQEALLAQRRA